MSLIDKKREILCRVFEKGVNLDETAKFLLQHLIEHDSLLKNLTFIEETTTHNYALSIKEEKPTEFHINGKTVTDGTRMICYFSPQMHEPIYIQLDVAEINMSEQYKNIVNQLPTKHPIKKEMVESGGKMQNLLKSKDEWLEAIDKALDNRDNKTWLSLTSEYNQLFPKDA